MKATREKYDTSVLFQLLKDVAKELSGLRKNHESITKQDMEEWDSLRLEYGTAIADAVTNERHLTMELYDRLGWVISSMRDLINYQENCDYCHSSCGAFQNMANLEVLVGRIHGARELGKKLREGGGANRPRKPDAA